MERIKKWWRIIYKAFGEFMSDSGMKLSASLSYYTLFSLGPMLVVIISFAGIFFGREAAQGRIYDQIKGLIGPDAALQVQSIIANIQHTDGGVTGAIIGISPFIAGRHRRVQRNTKFHQLYMVYQGQAGKGLAQIAEEPAHLFFARS